MSKLIAFRMPTAQIELFEARCERDGLTATAALVNLVWGWLAPDGSSAPAPVAPARPPSHGRSKTIVVRSERRLEGAAISSDRLVAALASTRAQAIIGTRSPVYAKDPKSGAPMLKGWNVLQGYDDDKPVWKFEERKL